MTDPSQCRYSETHEWFHAEGDLVTIGITQFAADELTDITYVEMKDVGETLDGPGSIGEVESVKTTADVYSVVAGEIVGVNEALTDDPSLLNSDPQGAGWLVKIRAADRSPLESLMDHATYSERHPVG